MYKYILGSLLVSVLMAFSFAMGSWGSKGGVTEKDCSSPERETMDNAEQAVKLGQEAIDLAKTYQNKYCNTIEGNKDMNYCSPPGN